MALGHVTPEARALVHPKHAVDAAHDFPDNATDYTANRPRRPLAIARSALDTFLYNLARTPPSGMAATAPTTATIRLP